MDAQQQQLMQQKNELTATKEKMEIDQEEIKDEIIVAVHELILSNQG